MEGDRHRFVWSKPGDGLEESRLFEQVLYRELRDSYETVESPVELLDVLMRDAYVAIRPTSRKVTYSRCVAEYVPQRLGWLVSDVPVSGRHSIRSIEFGSWWIPIPNGHVPFQFSVQRLLGRWFFQIGERLGLSSVILAQADCLRGRDAARRAEELPPWHVMQKGVRAADRPLEAMETLYRAGALHWIEGRISCVVDTAHRSEEQFGSH